jgi:fructuronate reductase
MERLAPNVARYSYDRTAQKVGIIHFGIGAFHRAHQTWYTDLAMDGGERDWMISGISLRSETVAEQLNPQNGLYSLTERAGATAKTGIVGAVREVLVANEDAKVIRARLAAPECQIASFTVTEKGYCSAEDGSLDLVLADESFYPHLAAGLTARMKSGLPGLTLISCDNLAGNGHLLEHLLSEWCEARAPGLDEWIARECAFPSTMVDRIVPATIDADRDAIEETLDLRDEGAVLTERFSQWIIEDKFAGPRPGWENHGAQIVPDAAPYETAKLRMLNGAHSALAYCGLERGYTFVHEAIADPGLGRWRVG